MDPRSQEAETGPSWEVREGFLEEVNVKCKGLWDRGSGGMWGLLGKYSLGHSGRTLRGPQMPREQLPIWMSKNLFFF